MTHDNNRQSGAVFLEFAILLPLLILFMVGLIDLTRYFTTKIVLLHSAEVGLHTAQASEALEYDPYLSSNEARERQIVERRAIASEASSLPKLVLRIVAGVNGPLELVRFRHVTATSDHETSEPLEAAILLPGESAIVVPSHAQEASHPPDTEPKPMVWFDHPDICASQSPNCKTARKHSADVRGFFVVNMLREYPIVVELRTRFQFVNPFFGSTEIRARAVGYRERYPHFPNLEEQT